MPVNYYFDTAIWIDFYENRTGFNDEPLGEYAYKFISHIFAKKYLILMSDHVLKELSRFYSSGEVFSMLRPFDRIIRKIVVSSVQRAEAEGLAIKRSVPVGDALHAVVARDNKAVLVTRDKHFMQLNDVVVCFKPEDLFF